MRRHLLLSVFLLILTSCKKVSDSDNTQLLDNFTFKITQYGITWGFNEAHEYGQYANGDYWVIGPVNIVCIVNKYHIEGFSPIEGQDGSMVNPGTDNRQGYDYSISSYDASLNVSYKNGMPISESNPLILKSNEALVSTVSWLYNSETDTETDCPLPFNSGTQTPRPVLRTAAILTCVSEAPKDGSFRPPYCGSDKTTEFNVSQLKKDLLKNLSTSNLSDIPDVSETVREFKRVWLDHVNEWLGAYVHPSENMPHYGQTMSKYIGDAALLLNIDFSSLPNAPTKDSLLIEFIQLGIDLAGIADNGGNWPPNGGHLMGRKWPILFAGLMLDNAHLKDVGNWNTQFQEDEATFYISQTDVDNTNSAEWTPDSRIDAPEPYESSDIGLPEWGIRHSTEPLKDVRNWDAPYRNINGSSYCGFVLAAHIMNQKANWNHDALFDFTDRWWQVTDGEYGYQKASAFTKSMWINYRSSYPPVWISQ